MLKLNEILLEGTKCTFVPSDSFSLKKHNLEGNCIGKICFEEGQLENRLLR